MSSWVTPVCGLLIAGGLLLSLPSMATCSVEASDEDVATAPAADAVSGTPQRAAEPAPERLSAPTARSDSAPAPRARWHRYLPGMFK